MDIEYTTPLYDYTFEATFPHGTIEPFRLLAAKPTKSLYHKSGWYPLVTTFHSAGTDPMEPQVTQLLQLLGGFYRYGGELFEKFKDMANGMDEDIGKMMGEIRLTGQEGVWIFKEVWPHAVNFGDLCYSSDPAMDIEVTWRFKKCFQPA